MGTSRPFLAGSFLILFFAATAPRSCQLCGEPILLRSWYFTSAFRARWSDYALMAIIGEINLTAWSAMDI